MAAPSVSNSITELFASRASQGSLVDINPSTLFASDGVIGFGNGGWYIRGTTYGAGDGNAYGGLYIELDTAQSFGTDAYLAMTLRPINTNPAFSQTTGAGWGFMSPDGGGGYDEVAFSIAGLEPGTNSERYISLINPTKTTDRWASDAGFDATNVTHIFLVGWRSAAFSNGGFLGSATNANELLRITPLVLTGGEVGTPATFTDYTDWLDANWPLRQFSTSPTANMHYVNFPYRIEADYYRSENQVVQFHQPIDMSVNFPANHLNDGDIGHWINNPVGGDFLEKNKLFLTEQPHRWWSIGEPCVGTANDTLTVIGFGDVQISDGHVTTGCNFTDCGTLQLSAPTLIGCSIVDTKDTVAMDIVNTDNCQNIELKNGTTGVRFDFDGSASVTMSGWTFSGFTNDVEYTGSGTLTITATNGTTINSTLASGSGNIVVQGAIVQQGLSFAGLQSDSQVKIYETGTTNIIDSVESSGTTFSWVETYSSDQTVDYTIIKEGFLPIRVTGVALSDAVVPVAVQQVEDRAYMASTGLTYGSNVVINTGAKTVDVSANTTVQNLYNALNEFWRDQSALQNIKFPVITNGPNSFTFIDDWELTSGSFPYLSRDGVRYLATNGTRTAAWAAVLTAGNVTGLTAEYQQVEGSTPVDAQNSGNMDQLVQIYGDASHGNFDYSNYLYIKYQANGYDEAGLNVVDQYGQLEDQLYVVAIQPTQLDDFTGGDPSITGVTITDHGISPVSWNGKTWSITITDTSGNTGEAIHRWLNYNKSLDATFQSFEPFNLFDIVVDAGSTYETRRGKLIGSAGAALKGVRVVDGSGDPHPFFTRFQADDGSYYTPPQAITLSAPNLTAGRVQLFNVTTDTEIENTTITSGYTAGWVDGGDFTAGDTIRLRWTAIDKMEIEAFSSAPASGSVNFVDIPVSDDVYVNNAVDGSTITQFSADYIDDEVDLTVDADFRGVDLYAWWKHNLTTSQGVANFFGGCTAEDQANYRFNSSVVSILLDNVTAGEIIQLDNVRIYRSDESYPVKRPGPGIDVNWRDKVYLTVTGSGALTTAQQAQLAAAANSKYTQAELHTDLDAYTNKDDWKGTAGGGGGLDESGMHTALDNYTNKDNWKADVSGIGIAEQDIHDALDSYPNKADWDTALTESQIHNWLNSYDNKFAWQAPAVNIKKILKRL